MMQNADWARGPMTLHQMAKWPFMYIIRDVEGDKVHSEDIISSSTSWKSIDDMLTLKDIKDGMCGLLREEWAEGIQNQRKKLMFLAQTDRIIVDEQ